jgi:hypothetical protein
MITGKQTFILILFGLGISNFQEVQNFHLIMALCRLFNHPN